MGTKVIVRAVPVNIGGINLIQYKVLTSVFNILKTVYGAATISSDQWFFIYPPSI